MGAASQARVSARYANPNPREALTDPLDLLDEVVVPALILEPVDVRLDPALGYAIRDVRRRPMPASNIWVT